MVCAFSFVCRMLVGEARRYVSMALHCIVSALHTTNTHCTATANNIACSTTFIPGMPVHKV